jgi:hypothetical protein
MLLTPDRRALGGVATMTVAPDRPVVPVELRLESDEFSRYQAALVDPRDQRVLWTSGPLRSSERGAESIVAVAVPASLLASQRYAFELSGVDANGGRVTVGTYAVRIERR